MKKAAIFILAIMTMLSLAACEESEYEKAQDSFGNRLKTGDFSGMNESEKDVANDFSNWLAKQ